MKKNNLFKILGIFLVISLIPISIALTGVLQTDTFYDSSTLAPVTDVQEILYKCADSTCSTQGALIINQNTGSSNKLTFEYPYNPSSTSSNLDYYAHFSFKECYLPKEYKEWVWGYGTEVQYDYYFNKVASCRSPIDSFSVTNENYANEPVIINVAAILGADVHSAFTNLELDWFPTGYENHYSAQTKITLEILDESNNVIYTDSKTIYILMDAKENVQFKWTPSVKGKYSAKVTTDVVDCQCQSSTKQYSERIFEVWEARPQNECYTIINNLETEPTFAKAGDLITVSFKKISNYADNLFVKTSVPTRINYEIKQGGASVSLGDFLVSSNSNTYDYQEVTLPWTPSSGGEYSIKIEGIAESSVCIGKTNPSDTAILGVFVDDITKYNVQFEVKDSLNNPINLATVNFGSFAGQTNSAGKISFEVNPGTYTWQVSKTGYINQSGSLLVDSGKSVSIILVPEIVPGTFAPVLNIPNQYLTENSGYNDNMINLKEYTTDLDTPLDDLSYLIVSQSKTSLVECSIDVNKFLDCNIKENKVGFSEIVISVFDGLNTDSDSFIVYVGTFINGTMVKILYPTGGETLSGNVEISWIAVNTDGNPLLMSFYYSADNGATWNILSENETNDGSYNWNTKNYPLGKYLLKIKAFDTVSGTAVYDQTLERFTILNSDDKRKDSKKDEKIFACEPILECSDWNECYDGIQTRTCKDINFCGDHSEDIFELKNCGDVKGMVLELKTPEKEGSLFQNIFLWVLLIGLFLISLGIIFAFFLLLRK